MSKNLNGMVIQLARIPTIRNILLFPNEKRVDSRIRKFNEKAEAGPTEIPSS